MGSCSMARRGSLWPSLQIFRSAYCHLGMSDDHKDLYRWSICWIGYHCYLGCLSRTHRCLSRRHCYPCRYAGRGRRLCTSRDYQYLCFHLAVAPSLLLCSLVPCCRCICSSSWRTRLMIVQFSTSVVAPGEPEILRISFRREKVPWMFRFVDVLLPILSPLAAIIVRNRRFQWHRINRPPA